MSSGSSDKVNRGRVAAAMAAPPPPPPQLLFDDGSRVMQEEAVANGTLSETPSPSSIVNNSRGDIPLSDYYEVERISRDVLRICLDANQHETNAEPLSARTTKTRPTSRLILRVALQFPDELLEDSPDVCWLLDDQLRLDLEQERVIAASNSDSPENEETNISAFCFVLGDTTVHSCCPDEVAAQHLNADVLVHYGHACLSPTGTLPVLYSFGRLTLDVDRAVQQLEEERQKQNAGNDDDNHHDDNNKFLILYQVGYHHAMTEFQTQWKARLPEDDRKTAVQIDVAQIPSSNNRTRSNARRTTAAKGSASCCQTESENTTTICCQSSLRENDNAGCGQTTETAQSCCTEAADSTKFTGLLPEQKIGYVDNEDDSQKPIVLGGLELPSTISTLENLSEYTVLFIMASDPNEELSSSTTSSSPHVRQFVNSMLFLLSLPTPVKDYWIFTPPTNTLQTNISPSPALSRQLKRRFFLTQKARDAQVVGILVSNLSQQYLVPVIQCLQRIIQDAGKASYSFAVGKINPAKLANFAEIDVFCLVACREQCFLDQERDYAVPVVTPMELDVALGNLEWGAQPYSLDCQDILQRPGDHRRELDADAEEVDNDDADDAPYFSLVTGSYVSQKNPHSVMTMKKKDLDLANLPGQGQVMEYKSEAANFLKQREYHGLETLVGQTEAKAAVPGLSGIASNYSGS